MTNGESGKILTDNGCLDIVMKVLQYLLDLYAQIRNLVI
jgi:hypothetical protein